MAEIHDIILYIFLDSLGTTLRLSELEEQI